MRILKIMTPKTVWSILLVLCLSLSSALIAGPSKKKKKKSKIPEDVKVTIVEKAFKPGKRLLNNFWLFEASAVNTGKKPYTITGEIELFGKGRGKKVATCLFYFELQPGKTAKDTVKCKSDLPYKKFRYKITKAWPLIP